jgi:hypothetical protein
MTPPQVLSWIALTARRGAWAPILVFTLHMISVWGFDAYNHFPPIDLPFHLAGGAAIAFFLHHAVRAAATVRLTREADPATHAVLVVALAGQVAVLWECSELLLDRTFGTHAQLGIDDAMGDIFMGLAGAVCFVGAKAWRRGRRTQPASPAPVLESNE